MAPPLGDLLDHVDDLLRLAHVRHDREAFAACLFDLSQRCGRVTGRPLVDRDQRALSREPDRGGTPDPVGGSSDQCHFAFESLHARLLPCDDTVMT